MFGLLKKCAYTIKMKIIHLSKTGTFTVMFLNVHYPCKNNNNIFKRYELGLCHMFFCIKVIIKYQIQNIKSNI